jgi:hypothetical protein
VNTQKQLPREENTLVVMFSTNIAWFPLEVGVSYSPGVFKMWGAKNPKNQAVVQESSDGGCQTPRHRMWDTEDTRHTRPWHLE